MKIIDIGNISGNRFCTEFDVKIPLEDAANALADEYKDFSKSDDVSVRHGLGKTGGITYSIRTGFTDTRFKIGTYINEDMPVYFVEQGSCGGDFEDFHKHLQEKYVPGSE